MMLSPLYVVKYRSFSGKAPVITTETGEVTWVDEKEVDLEIDQSATSEIESIRFHGTATLRTNFKSILVDQQQDLALVSRRGHLLRIVLNKWNDSGVLCNCLELHHDTHRKRNIEWCDCERLKSNASLRTSDIVQEHLKKSYQIRVAKWRNGSRAYFDSRGLLHLVSANPKIPETTIVLYERGLAGWCADGRIWGSECFTGGQSNTSAKVIYEEVLRPFAREVASGE